MTDEHLTDLLAAYALDAVDHEERVHIDAHLAVCPRCRGEVQDHREAASHLAFAGAPAPDGVWDRISAALAEPPPDLRLVPAGRARAPRRVWARPALTALAAAAVVAALLGVQLRNQDRRIDELRAALRDPLVPAFQATLEDPDSHVIRLTSADGDISLRGVVTSDGLGYLRATALPSLPDGATYQLWGGAGDRLISLAVLGPEPRVVTFQARHYTLFAITAEDAPGVVVTANPPVVAGTTA